MFLLMNISDDHTQNGYEAENSYDEKTSRFYTLFNSIFSRQASAHVGTELIYLHLT